jgi:hypothetical protein
VVGLRFREVVDDNNDVETTAPRGGTTTTTTTNDEKEKTKPKKKTLSLTVTVDPRVLSKTRKFDSNDIRIIRAERATAVAATPRVGSGNEDEDEDNDDDDDDDDDKSKPAVAAAVVDEDQRDDEDTSKSALRLLKARRLLEMAQISPSQRLESMQRSMIVSTTVVPMGSYSMRFGGYGSLEEELESNNGRVEMRMADTFDRCVSFRPRRPAKEGREPGAGWWARAKGGRPFRPYTIFLRLIFTSLLVFIPFFDQLVRSCLPFCFGLGGGGGGVFIIL